MALSGQVCHDGVKESQSKDDHKANDTAAGRGVKDVS